MTRAVLFDTETTGLDPLTGDRVIEVACLELLRELPTGRVFHALIHPGRDIPDDAVRVHGITLDSLRDRPRFHAVADDLIAFLGDGKLIAHNAAFDFGFLDAEFARTGHPALDRSRMIDTLALAKARFPGLPNSLDALCRRFGVDLSERVTHNALLDCHLLAEVYIELTGGRQRVLFGSESAGPRATPHGGFVAVARPTGPAAARTPRAVAPTEAELAAHTAFVSKLPTPVWATVG